ncbi:MAG: hypothetical protein U9O50_04450, partial [Acidobacteriota bacterium]|nr:hypothetical protein [Acidobacteriota bacterium]
RTAGTFCQQMFRESLLLVQITQALAFIAILTLVFFFASFLKDYFGKEDAKLKNATVFALIGYILVTMLYLKGLLFVFNVRDILSSRPYFIESLIPWVGSLSLLVFFIAFYKNPLTESRKSVKKAVIFSIVGAAIALVIRSFVLLRCFYFQEIRWITDLPEKFKIIVIPLVFFSFATIFYFFFHFYKHAHKHTE